MCTDPGYALGNDLSSSMRLNFQHYLWKEELGYLLHPSIPVDKENLRIADIGTGTGIWLVEVSHALPPSTRLDGFDNDLSQCPPVEWLPDNVALHDADIFSDVPDSHVEKYDVIHVRLMFLAVRDDNPENLLRIILRMLKPGGYIQWSELDIQTRFIESPKLSQSFENVKTLVDYIDAWTLRNRPTTWVSNLVHILERNDLQYCILSRSQSSPARRRYETENALMTYGEFSRKVLDNQGDGAEGDMLRGLISNASRECQSGVAILSDKVTVVGRKKSITL